MTTRNASRGQIMLLTVLILGGVFAIGLTVSTLLLSEVRLARQTLDSVKAVYAAESGLEWELFRYFKGTPERVTPAGASASNTVIGSSPAYAIDGSVATAWNAGNFPPQWIQIDLGALYEIRRVRLYTSQLPDGNTRHIISMGDTPGTLVPRADLQGFTRDRQWLEWTAAPPVPNVRYVRVETTESPSWVSWFEIEVYREGTSGSGPTMTNDTSFTSLVNPGAATSVSAIGISGNVRRGLEVFIPI